MQRFSLTLARRPVESGDPFSGLRAIPAIASVFGANIAEPLDLLTFRRTRKTSAKKNAGDYASAGILFQNRQAMFQRKRRLTRQGRVQRR
jgi:hypothetical protein